MAEGGRRRRRRRKRCAKDLSACERVWKIAGEGETRVMRFARMMQRGFPTYQGGSAAAWAGCLCRRRRRLPAAWMPRSQQPPAVPTPLAPPPPQTPAAAAPARLAWPRTPAGHAMVVPEVHQRMQVTFVCASGCVEMSDTVPPYGEQLRTPDHPHPHPCTHTDATLAVKSVPHW